MKGYESFWRSVVIAGIAAASLSFAGVAQAQNPPEQQPAPGAQMKQQPGAGMKQGMNQQSGQKFSANKYSNHKKFSSRKHHKHHMAQKSFGHKAMATAGSKQRKLYGTTRKQPGQQSNQQLQHQLQGTGGARGTSQ